MKTMKQALGSLLLCLVISVSSIQAQNGLYLSGGGEVHMNNSSSIYVKGTNVSLNIASTSTFEATGQILVEGDLTNTGTFNSNDAIVEMFGHLNNSGTFTTGTSSIELSGANNDTVSLAGIQFYNLEVNNGIGNTVIVQGDFSIANQLSMSSGHINTTADYTINMLPGATISGESNDSYVKGNISATRRVGGVAADNFAGLGVSIDPSGNNLGNVTVTRTTGLETINVSHKDAESIDRIWDISPTFQPSSNVSLTLDWLSNNDYGLPDLTQAQVYKSVDNGINWSKVGSETDVSAARSITLSVSSFSDWTVSGPEIFPVELVAFNAEAKAHAVSLTWTTGLEINSDHFQLQRSADLSTYENIGKVKAQGNSSTVSHYNFLDLYPLQETKAYYRLKMVDLDGSFEYSGVRIAQFGEFTNNLAISSIHPNPFQDNVTVNYYLQENSSLEIQLMDLSGKPVYNNTIFVEKGNNTIQLSTLGNLAEGLYQVRILNLATQEGVSSLVSLKR